MEDNPKPEPPRPETLPEETKPYEEPKGIPTEMFLEPQNNERDTAVDPFAVTPVVHTLDNPTDETALVTGDSRVDEISQSAGVNAHTEGIMKDVQRLQAGLNLDGEKLSSTVPPEGSTRKPWNPKD